MYTDVAGYGFGDSDPEPNNLKTVQAQVIKNMGSFSGMVWLGGRLADLVDAGGGTRTFTAGKHSYTLTIPVRPNIPLADGYEWHFYANEKDGHIGWWQKKKGGGILGAVASVAKVAVPIAALALPIVGPAVGIGAGVIGAATTAKKVVDAGTGVVNTVKQIAGPSSASVPALPSTPPQFDPVVYQQPGGAMITDVRPNTTPSWVVPAGLGVVALLLLSDRR